MTITEAPPWVTRGVSGRSVIGLNGRKQSGKDTAAQALIKRGYQRLAFADPVKQSALALDPYVRAMDGSFHRLTGLHEHLGWELAKEIPDVRRLLQRLGTEVGRDILSDRHSIWTNIAARAAYEHQRVVFTDLRFADEADLVRALGGMVIRIERPGEGAGVDETATHSSEVFDFEADCVIVNDGTIAELHDKVLAATLDFHTGVKP